MEFEVRGLAGRRDTVAYQLDSRVNIFFGLNGTGKTSLLKILHSALEDEPNVLLDVPFRSARVVIYSHTLKRTFERTITRKHMGTTKERDSYQLAIELGKVEGHAASGAYEEMVRQRSEFDGWHTKPSVPLSGLIHCYLTTSRMASDLLGSRWTQYVPVAMDSPERQLDRLFATQIQRLWRSYTNNLLSEIRGIQEAGLAEILHSVLFPPGTDTAPTSLSAKAAFDRVNNFLGRQGRRRAGAFETFSDSYKRNAQIRSVVHDIDSIERRIERAEEPRRRLIELIKQFVGKDKEVIFDDNEIKVKAHGQEIALYSLSSGEKQLIRILVETIGAEANTVMIDEPELSMHIDWQRYLVEAMHLINPGAQIILATHSPEIMENVADEKIYRL
ncbi:ATP-binding protein [Microbispora bryophytorum]|uniref:ATP-binding protein n=1 Tax=Microbispora bryophytorum TaxID=1460882 RepID=UPI0033D61A16